MQTVAETAEFVRRAESLLGLSQRTALIEHLAKAPKSGSLMQSTGGIRKLRWAREGAGKSSGVRVIYYYHDKRMPLYLLTLFGKNEKANLSKAERNELAKLVTLLIEAAGVKK